MSRGVSLDALEADAGGAELLQHRAGWIGAPAQALKAVGGQAERLALVVPASATASGGHHEVLDDVLRSGGDARGAEGQVDEVQRVEAEGAHRLADAATSRDERLRATLATSSSLARTPFMSR